MLGKKAIKILKKKRKLKPVVERDNVPDYLFNAETISYANMRMLLMVELIQMPKPFYTLNHTEALVKKTKYTEEKLTKKQ